MFRPSLARGTKESITPLFFEPSLYRQPQPYSLFRVLQHCPPISAYFDHPWCLLQVSAHNKHQMLMLMLL